MAKIERSEIRIVDNETGNEINYEAENMPFEASVGNNWFCTAGPEVIEALQQKGYEFYNEDDFSRAIEDKFGLPADSLGKRGAPWNTIQARARYSVFVNGDEFKPALTPAMLKSAEKVATERKVKTFSLPKVKASADKAPVYDKEAIMAKILEFKKAGHSEEIIAAGLSSKLGSVETAQALVSEALHPDLDL